MARWIPFLTAGLLLSAAPAPEKPAPYQVRVVSFEIQREPDGKKYPNPTTERFSLEADGTLRYSANFGGLPTNMNHGDSAEWPAGAAGRKVLETALRMAEQRTPGLKDLPDDASTPERKSGVYVVGLTRRDADSTRVVVDPRSKAWAKLGPAFSTLIAAFEKATGRPLDPGALPQRRAKPPQK